MLGIQNSLASLARKQYQINPTQIRLALHFAVETAEPIVRFKAHLRRIETRTFTNIFQAFTEICDLFSPEECWNYFKAAECVANQSLDALIEFF